MLCKHLDMSSIRSPEIPMPTLIQKGPQPLLPPSVSARVAWASWEIQVADQPKQQSLATNVLKM